MSAEDFLAPVVRESTTSIVVRNLRAAISHGQLAPGTQLSEVALAKSLDVSRGPLREAIQHLTQEGLLVTQNGRGLYVASMGPADIRDLYTARRAVEREALVRLFADDPAAIGRVLLDRHVDDDMEFHQALVSHAESPRLRRIHQTLVTETRMCVCSVPENVRDVARRIADHEAIATALVDGHFERADRVLVDHLDHAAMRLAAAVGDQGRAPAHT